MYQWAVTLPYILLLASSMYSGEISIPTKFLPVSRAASPVVPATHEAVKYSVTLIAPTQNMVSRKFKGEWSGMSYASLLVIYEPVIISDSVTRYFLILYTKSFSSASIRFSIRTSNISAFAPVLLIGNQVHALWCSFREHKHIFKAGIVPIGRREG